MAPTAERKPPQPPPDEAEPEPEPEPEPKPLAVPTSCEAGGAEICQVPPEFAAQLCKRREPSVALAMFRKGTPWKRAYVRAREVEAWYVAKGRRTSPTKLKLFEELVILADRTQADGGIKVSGFGSYDALRWDGSCVSVMSDEVSLRPVGTPAVAPIPWRKLDPDVRVALKKDRRIAHRDQLRLEHCRTDKSSTRCERARQRLSQMIAAYVRGGGDLPAPDALR